MKFKVACLKQLKKIINNNFFLLNKIESPEWLLVWLSNILDFVEFEIRANNKSIEELEEKYDKLIAETITKKNEEEKKN